MEVVDPNLPLKFHPNWVGNSLDIADHEFVVVVAGWWCVQKVIFVSNHRVELTCVCG